MRNDHFDNSQKDLSNQDLSELLQRGRSLHDQAIYEFFQALVGKVRSLFKKGSSFSAQDNGVKVTG